MEKGSGRGKDREQNRENADVGRGREQAGKMLMLEETENKTGKKY